MFIQEEVFSSLREKLCKYLYCTRRYTDKNR